LLIVWIQVVYKVIMSIKNTTTMLKWRSKGYFKLLRIKYKGVSPQMVPKKQALLIKFRKNKQNYLDRVRINPKNWHQNLKLNSNNLIHPPREKQFSTRWHIIRKKRIFQELVVMVRSMLQLIKLKCVVI